MNSTEAQIAKSYWRFDLPGEVSIPVAKPRLPSFDAIASYLRRIDESRWYSNGGPLVQEFEKRLAAHIGQGTARVATVANATVGLTLALLAHNRPMGTLCMVPAWTFAATAHAVQLAGLVPWIVDVALTNWALEADAARDLLRDAPGPVSAVIPVSPFGAPIDFASWKSFRDDTGVAVVIDAAASFDTVHATAVPAVVSLHATKVLGIGEGGFVVTTDSDFIEEVQKRANFGFWNSREATGRSINGKISEYAAAVGLASLDAWPATRADFARVACTYRNACGSEPDVVLQQGFGDRWITSTVVVAAQDECADVIGRALAANGIGSRRWWGGGLHRHSAFEKLPRGETKNTELLVDRVIGLPSWRDLPDQQIVQICDVVCSARG
jgi:dTDP-4-amino-4,6-dideoxygalactose transaminase